MTPKVEKTQVSAASMAQSKPAKSAEEKKSKAAIKMVRPKQNKAPQKPVAKEVTVTVTEGMSLLGLAGKYNTKMADIRKLNHLKGDNLKIGQKLRIMATDAKELKAYEEYQAQIIEQKNKQAEKANIQRKNKLAEGRIAQAKSYGLGEDYSFKKDEKTGNIIVTVKDEKTLAEIKEDFNLPDGSLRETNGNLKPGTVYTGSSGEPTDNYDVSKIGKGGKVVINTDHFKPEKPFSQEVKDWAKSIYHKIF
ncbi:MAG: LysM peptidoglycan-binding domain-containing protein [Clostridiaceae bacterium]|jgi:LysM repeat protein|nr:LysM peptidoglycan-binding domain-containing protein [Clostridiaceae bacterium]